MSNDVSKPILQVSHVTKVYGREYEFLGKKIGRRVVGAEDVSFTVKSGEIFGFLGPNGAGKTTTMRCILDYLNMQEGSITIFGLDHHIDALKIREDIGYIPGDLALFKNFTGNELIDYFGKFRPIDQDFLKELRSLFRVDLSLKIKALSSGNRQQAGIIVALASKPDFLLLDEPTSGLDPLMTANFHRVIKKLRTEGKTIFLSSHDLAEVQAVCDRVGIIREGKIILIEEVENLREKFVQHVSIKFDPSNLPTLTDFPSDETIISVEQIKKTVFNLTISKDINPLLQWLNNYQINRLTIEDASLEEIFLQYYE
ncbi:MAG: ABC transporter ATP-binding protein [Candidatus Hodarchaeales archaeon]|jgi:ABC-2 type transport system ATP-binding protein